MQEQGAWGDWGRVRNGRSSRAAAGYGVKPDNELQLEEFKISTKYIYEMELMLQPPIAGSTRLDTTATVTTTGVYYEPQQDVYLEAVAALSIDAPKLQVVYDASVRSLDNRIGTSENLFIVSFRTTSVLQLGNGFQISGASSATIGLLLLCSPEGLKGLTVDDYKCLSSNPGVGSPVMRLTLITGPHPPTLYSFKVKNSPSPLQTRDTGVWFEIGTYAFGSRRVRRLLAEAEAGNSGLEAMPRRALKRMPELEVADASANVGTDGQLKTPAWFGKDPDNSIPGERALMVDRHLAEETLAEAVDGLYDRGATKSPQFPLSEISKLRRFLQQRNAVADLSSQEDDATLDSRDISDALDSWLLETLANSETDPLEQLSLSPRNLMRAGVWGSDSSERAAEEVANVGTGMQPVHLIPPLDVQREAPDITVNAESDDSPPKAILFHPSFIRYLKKRRRELQGGAGRVIDKPMVIGMSPHPAVYCVKTMASFFWVSGSDVSPDYLGFLGKDDRPQKNTKVFFAFKLTDTLPRRSSVKMVLKAPEGFSFDAKCTVDLQPVFRKGYTSNVLTHRYLVRRSYTQKKSTHTTTSTTTTTTGPRYGPQDLNFAYESSAVNQFQAVGLPLPAPYDRTDGVPSAITEYLANLTRTALETTSGSQVMTFDGATKSARFAMSDAEKDNQWGIQVESCTGDGPQATLEFSPNPDYSYMLAKNTLYYFGIWVRNPTVASRYGWFSMDFETETSGQVEAYAIRTMSKAQLFPISQAYAPLPSDATARTSSNIRVTFTPVTPITPLYEYIFSGRRQLEQVGESGEPPRERVDARNQQVLYPWQEGQGGGRGGSGGGGGETREWNGFNTGNAAVMGMPRKLAEEGEDMPSELFGATGSLFDSGSSTNGIFGSAESASSMQAPLAPSEEDPASRGHRALQGQVPAAPGTGVTTTLTGSQVEIVAPLGFEFQSINGRGCAGFQFYPSDNILDAFFEGEHVKCSVAGQKVKVVFIGTKGLESGISYVLAADLMNADRSKANILTSASWIIQTYQYQDEDVNNGVAGNLVAMDEVLIPTYSMNNYVERWAVDNYWGKMKGKELIEDLRFRMKFFGHVQSGQILYMEPPQGFELHELKTEMDAPVNQLEHGVQPCYGFQYTGQYPYFFTTPSPVCGCYFRDLLTEEPLSYLFDYNEVRSTTSTTPPPVNPDECPRITSKTGTVKQCYLRINVFERNAAVWYAALNDPNRALFEFSLKTVNPEETPFVTRNYWQLWQYTPSDLFLRSRLEFFRKDVTDGRVPENHIFLPGNAARVFPPMNDGSSLRRTAAERTAEGCGGGKGKGSAGVDAEGKCAVAEGSGGVAPVESHELDREFQAGSALFDEESATTSMAEGYRKTRNLRSEKETILQGKTLPSQFTNVHVVNQEFAKEIQDENWTFETWSAADDRAAPEGELRRAEVDSAASVSAAASPSASKRSYPATTTKPSPRKPRRRLQYADVAGSGNKKQRKRRRLLYGATAGDLILVPYQDNGLPDMGVLPQRFSVLDDNWLLMKPRLNTAEMVPPLHQLVVEAIFKTYRAGGATASGTTQDAISNSNEWGLLQTGNYLSVQSSAVAASWTIRSQLVRPHFANVGRAARTGALTDLLIQFTPLHEANVCVFQVRQPEQFSFNQSTAFLNVTKVPFLVEARKAKVLEELENERNRMNALLKKLNAEQHERLSKAEFHTNYHQKFTQSGCPRNPDAPISFEKMFVNQCIKFVCPVNPDEQNHRSKSYIEENYFLQPTLKYNHTSLSPTLLYPQFYLNANVSSDAGHVIVPMQNEAEWVPLRHHYDVRLAPSQLILVNCTLCPQQRTQILIRNVTTGNYTEGMRLSLISYYYNSLRSPLPFYNYATGYTFGLDEMLDYTEETWTGFQLPGRVKMLYDWKNEVRVAGYVEVRGIPVLLGEDTVRCQDGIVGPADPSNNASNVTQQEQLAAAAAAQQAAIAAIPEGVDPIEYQMQANLNTLTGEALMEYFGRSKHEIVSEYQELDRLRSLRNDPFKFRILPDGTRLGGYNAKPSLEKCQRLKSTDANCRGMLRSPIGSDGPVSIGYR
eukprot:g12125.t1